MSDHLNNQALFEAIVRNVRDVITIIDHEGTIQYQSDSVEPTFGYGVNELIGVNVISLIHPDDAEAATDALRLAVNGRDKRRFLCRFKHKTEGWLFVEAAGQMLDEGPIQGLILNTRDVSDWQRSLEALRSSQELFKAAFNATSAIGTITVPETGEYIDINEQFTEQVGWERHEIIGKTSTEIGIWGAPENRDLAVKRLARDGVLRQYRANLLMKDGSERTYLIDAQYIFQDANRRMYLSAIDITEREQAEAQLRQSQKMEAIGQLTGGIAHDFNNLLSVIIGHAELAALDSARHQDISSSTEAILQAASSGAQLIQRMMAFSRKQNLSPENIEICERIESLHPLLQTTVGKNIHLNFDFPTTACWANIDPSQFDAAILNLVINARDAMPDGGELNTTISRKNLNRTSAEQFEISAGEYLHIALSDTGFGMSDEAADRAFEPFFTTKQKAGGTGLGLSMVFGFVRQSGGQVSIDTVAGTGTRVSLLIPETRRHDVATDLPQLNRTAPSGTRILVIEDNHELRNLLVPLLEDRLTARVTSLASAEGIDDLDAREFDLLLTDVMLPGSMRGPDIALQLRRDNPQLAVLYMSGFEAGILSPNDIIEGRVEFIAKPFTNDQLLYRLTELLE